jgi:hypothetical protein
MYSIKKVDSFVYLNKKISKRTHISNLDSKFTFFCRFNDIAQNCSSSLWNDHNQAKQDIYLKFEEFPEQQILTNRILAN